VGTRLSAHRLLEIIITFPPQRADVMAPHKSFEPLLQTLNFKFARITDQENGVNYGALISGSTI